MKLQNVRGSMGLLFAACMTSQPEEAQERTGDSLGLQSVPAMPEAAVAAMKAAKSASLVPQFHACPYYLTFKGNNFDELGSTVPGWVGVELELFTIDRPSWFVLGGTLVVVCGTTQSPHTDSMNVRRPLTGVTQCTTSTIGTVNAWFVCT